MPVLNFARQSAEELHMCRGSLKMVPISGLGRVVICPVCGTRVRTMKRTLDWKSAQICAHSAGTSPVTLGGLRRAR
jgi:hypothetical protein